MGVYQTHLSRILLKRDNYPSLFLLRELAELELSSLQGDEDAVELGEFVVELLFVLDCLLLALSLELLFGSEDERDENEVNDEVISLTLF